MLLSAGDLLSFDMSPLQRFAVYFEGAERSPFQELGDFRGVYEALAATKPKSILVDLRNSTKPKAVLDALCSAVTVGGFKFPKYGAKPQEDRGISIDVLAEQAEGLQEIMDHSLLSAESSNLVRHLTMRAGNDLKPATYVNDVKEMAKDWGVDFEFIDFDKLMDMKAGAFVAVAQGSPDHDAPRRRALGTARVGGRCAPPVRPVPRPAARPPPNAGHVRRPALTRGAMDVPVLDGARSAAPPAQAG